MNKIAVLVEHIGIFGYILVYFGMYFCDCFQVFAEMLMLHLNLGLDRNRTHNLGTSISFMLLVIQL
jgi:hypothetical protein